MAYWDRFKSWLGEPMRSGGEYEGINQDNYALPGAQARGENADRVAADALNRTAPQSANDSQFRGAQQAAIGLYQQRAADADLNAGKLVKNYTDQGIQQQRSLQATANPNNAAMMARMASQNVGQMQQGAANTAAQIAVSDRNAAMQGIGGIAGQARGQDLQNSQFNVGAQLQNRGMNDAMWGQAQGVGLQNAGMQQQGSMAYEQNRAGRYGALLGTPANWEGMLSAGSGIAGAAAMASDERVKTNVQDGGDEADSFLDSVEATTFNYKTEYDPDQVPMLEDYHKTQGIRDKRLGIERPVQHTSPTPRPQSLTERSVSAIDKQTPPSGVVLTKDPPRSDEGLIDRYPYVKLERTQPLGPAIDNAVGRNVPTPPPRQSLKESGVLPKPPVLGVMAQPVEKTALGAPGVQPDANGVKTINPQRLTGALLAGLGRLNQRLKEVEAPKNKGRSVPMGRIGR